MKSDPTLLFATCVMCLGLCLAMAKSMLQPALARHKERTELARIAAELGNPNAQYDDINNDIELD